jgi:LCP family protein required for cell wall assembly
MVILISNVKLLQIPDYKGNPMNKSGNKRRIRRIIAAILLSITGVLLVLAVGAYLYIHSFINKMKLVDLPEGEDIYAYGAGSDMEDTAEYEGLMASDNSLQNGDYNSGEDMNCEIEDGVQSNAFSGAGYADDSASNSISNFSLDSAADIDGNENEAYASDAEIALLEDKIRRNAADAGSLFSDDKDVLNILLIGSDSRSRSKRGLSDSMILLSINRDKKRIVATSLLRDIYLEIADNNYNRLNTAYASGGAGLLMDTIEKNFKVKVDKYIGIDFYAFIDVIDAIGGITLNITREEIPVINGYIDELNKLLGDDKGEDYIYEAGEQYVNGKQALGYSRVRYIGTDFGRTKRQRRVLELIYEKIKKLKMTELNKLLDVFLPKVTTNFKESEILFQLFKLPDYLKYDFEQLCIPVEGSYKNMRIRGMAVLGIDFEKNISELYKKVYLTD